MAVVKRDNSVYWYSIFSLNGKKYIKSTRTTNRALAHKIDQQYQLEVLEQTKLGGKVITLREAFSLFVNTKKDNKNYYLQMMAVFRWVNEHMNTDQPLTNIDTRFLHDYVDKRSQNGSKLSSIKHNLGLIIGAIKFSRKLGYAVSSIERPTIRIKNTKTRVLSIEEEERLLSALIYSPDTQINNQRSECRKDLHDLIVVLLSTGCRWSEIAEMKWEQVDFDNRLIHIWRKKTSSASVVPMSNKAYSVLVERVQRSNWVFPNQNGDGPKCYTSDSFKRACLRAGIEGVTFHTTRHTTITRLTQAGLSLAQVQAISGHSNLQSLQRYQHLTSLDVVDKARSILNK